MRIYKQINEGRGYKSTMPAIQNVTLYLTLCYSINEKIFLPIPLNTYKINSFQENQNIKN